MRRYYRYRFTRRHLFFTRNKKIENESQVVTFTQTHTYINTSTKSMQKRTKLFIPSAIMIATFAALYLVSAQPKFDFPLEYVHGAPSNETETIIKAFRLDFDIQDTKNCDPANLMTCFDSYEISISDEGPAVVEYCDIKYIDDIPRWICEQRLLCKLKNVVAVLDTAQYLEFPIDYTTWCCERKPFICMHG